jgi:hypothetical protein
VPEQHPTTRKTLIEIARKKQDRSMITAWGQFNVFESCSRRRKKVLTMCSL